MRKILRAHEKIDCKSCLHHSFTYYHHNIHQTVHEYQFFGGEFSALTMWPLPKKRRRRFLTMEKCWAFRRFYVWIVSSVNANSIWLSWLPYFWILRSYPVLGLLKRSADTFHSFALFWWCIVPATAELNASKGECAATARFCVFLMLLCVDVTILLNFQIVILW